MKRLVKSVAKWWLGNAASSNLTKRNAFRPTFDQLEDRWAPAVLAPVEFQPNVEVFNASSAAVNNTTNPGYTPVQIRSAYGINNISFNGTQGDGSGQTIAIVDAFNDPNLLSDLDTFDQSVKLTATSSQTLFQQYGAASSFVKVYNEQGVAINPASTNVPVDPAAAAGQNNWETEESLDIQQAHAIAPGAKIDFVEANSASNNNSAGIPDLYAAVQAAAKLPGVSVVSMSFGGAENPSETQLDSTFTTPAGHQGVTFVASTGDSGAPGEYGAFSPNVVAVGASVLTLGANNSYGSEVGWSGSGGGISQVEKEPTYQDAFQTTGMRSNPDVAFNGGATVSVYDSYYEPGFITEYGTSVSAPSIAGLFAIANQGRVLNGLSTFNSNGNNVQALQALYSLSENDFHAVTSPAGINGTTSTGLVANSGYNYVTGRGTPVANLLVADLANYGKPVAVDHLVITSQPSSTTAGSTFTLVVKAENASGAVDTSFTGTITLTLGTNPGSGTLGGTVTVQAINGVATFSNLTINNAGSGYVIQATSSGINSVSTSAFTVTAPAPVAPAAPTLLTPLGTITSTTPTFSFTAVSGASHYLLTIKDTTTGQLLVNNASITSTSATLSSALTAGQSYTWSVVAVASNGLSSAASQGSFSVQAAASIAAPVLTGPTGTISTTTPVFSWNAVSGAVRYYLTVKDTTTGQVIVNNASVTGTSVSVGTLTVGQSYTWSVVAVASTGVSSAASQASFTVAAARLAAPVLSGAVGTLTTTLPTFAWSAVTGAASYTIQVVDLATNQVVLAGSVPGTVTAAMPASSSALKVGHEYGWTVVAVDANGNAGVTSSEAVFTIASNTSAALVLLSTSNSK